MLKKIQPQRSSTYLVIFLHASRTLFFFLLPLKWAVVTKESPIFLKTINTSSMLSLSKRLNSEFDWVIHWARSQTHICPNWNWHNNKDFMSTEVLRGNQYNKVLVIMQPSSIEDALNALPHSWPSQTWTHYYIKWSKWLLLKELAWFCLLCPNISLSNFLEYWLKLPKDESVFLDGQKNLET